MGSNLLRCVERLIESDNGNDHRAGTIDLFIEKHMQVRLRVHRIVITPIPATVCVGDSVVCPGGTVDHFVVFAQAFHLRLNWWAEISVPSKSI
jgi:hypothetical protein